MSKVKVTALGWVVPVEMVVSEASFYKWQSNFAIFKNLFHFTFGLYQEIIVKTLSYQN